MNETEEALQVAAYVSDRRVIAYKVQLATRAVRAAAERIRTLQEARLVPPPRHFTVKDVREVDARDTVQMERSWAELKAAIAELKEVL